MSDHLITLINKYQFKRGIEIGVRYGDNCIKILKNTQITDLVGLDHKSFLKAKIITNYFPSRFEFIVGESPGYAENYDDKYFDFIYIDANHSYEAVRADLEAWFPKLRSNGMFCGDDYLICNNPTEGPYGVVLAVNCFLSLNGLQFHLNDIEKINWNDRIDFATKWGKVAEDNLNGKEYKDVPDSFWWTIK